MAELKPCPFCGGENIAIMMRMPMSGGMIGHYVSCCGCGARTALHYEEQLAVEAWNRRYEPMDEIDFDYAAED